MFVVQPFRKDPDIRSVLGFMSIASRWGHYLFPGITVLTRDLYAVQAMHQVAIRMRAWEPRGRVRFQKRSTDAAIARQLKRILPAGRRDDDAKLLQVMTYWQRYGSLFQHFGLLTERRHRSIRGYRQMIFASRPEELGEDTKSVQRRRITHFEWYRRHRRRLVDAPTGDGGRGLLHGPHGQWRRWWLTGLGAPPRIPKPILLVRQLEFFFTVWQTLFEAGARSAAMSGRLPKRAAPGRDLVAEFATLLLEARSADSEELNRRLVRVCLTLHERFVAPHVARWQRDVVQMLGPAVRGGPFFGLHDGSTIRDFADREGSSLLTSLADLHNEYCGVQGKPYAACVARFRPRPVVMRRPSISATLGGRWGLFGYRFEAAVGLFNTAENMA